MLSPDYLVVYLFIHHKDRSLNAEYFESHLKTNPKIKN